jgi:hypothetical protein
MSSNLDVLKNSLVETDSKNEKEKHDIENKYTVFISGAPADIRYEAPKTGDFDYAATIAGGINQLHSNKCNFIHGLLNEDAIYKFINEHTLTENPILHIMLNPPQTGMMFSREGLRKYIQGGGVLVVTVLEFRKFNNLSVEEGVKIKNEIMNRLALASATIFLDDFDKQGALQYSKDNPVWRCNLPTVINVPSTLCLPTALSPMERGKNLLFFGMLREGKGIRHIIKLAYLMKNNFLFKDRKIIIVGSIFDHIHKSEVLERLVTAIFPEKKEAIKDQTAPQLKILLSLYEAEVQTGTLKKDLPIDIHLNVPVVALPRLFNECTYAILATLYGIALRYTTPASLLAQRFVIFTHWGPSTPTILQAEPYQSAFVLIKNTALGSVNTPNGYAGEILEHMTAREQDPRLNMHTLKFADQLYAEQLSLSMVAKHYCKIHELAKNKTLLVSSFKKWKSNSHSRRAYRILYDYTNIKINYRPFKKLLAELKNIEGDLPPSVRILLTKKRTEGLLVPEEIKLYKILDALELSLRHVTSESTYEKIQHSQPPKLLSLTQQDMVGLEVNTLNTPLITGERGYVFCSLHYGEDTSIPRFLANENTVITMKLDEDFIQHNPNILKGSSSDHFAAYLAEQTSVTLLIHDVEYFVTKQKKTDPVGGHFYEKKRTFRHGDGKIYEKTIRMGEECFPFVLVKKAAILMFIRDLRYLDEQTWNKVVESDPTSIINIFKALYHPGIFEFRVPVEINLNSKSVRVTKRVCLLHPSDKDYGEKQRKELAGYISSLQSDTLLPEPLPKDFDILVRFKDIQVNLLGAAIVKGNLTVVQRLLEQGTNINSLIYQDIADKIYAFSPLLLIAAVSSYDQWVRINNSSSHYKAAKAEKRDKFIYNSSPQSQPPSLDVLHKMSLMVLNGSSITRDLRSLPFFGEKTIEASIFLCKAHFTIILELLSAYNFYTLTPKRILLTWGIYSGNEQVVQKMLEMGVDPNMPHYSHFGFAEISLGITPLSLAIIQNRHPIVTLILKQGGNVESLLLKDKLYEDFSTLMCAVQFSDVPMAQLLLSKDANLNYRTKKGESALSLARKLGKIEFIEFFQQQSPNTLDKLIDEDKRIQEDIKTLPDVEGSFNSYSFLIMSQNESGSFFVLYPTGYYLSTLPLPWHTSNNKEEWLKIFNSYFYLDIDPLSVQWRVLEPQISKVNKNEYCNYITICYLPSLSQRAQKQFSSNKKFFVVHQAKIEQMKRNQQYIMEIDSYPFGSFIYHLLDSVLQSGRTVLTKKYQTILQSNYQKIIEVQHAFINAFYQEDIKCILELEKSGLAHPFYPIIHPRLRARIFFWTIDKDNNLDITCYMLNKILEFKKFSCRTEDLFKIHPNLLTKALEQGHLGLYKIFHKYKTSEIEPQLEAHFKFALAHNHLLLGEYLYPYVATAKHIIRNQLIDFSSSKETVARALTVADPKDILEIIHEFIGLLFYTAKCSVDIKSLNLYNTHFSSYYLNVTLFFARILIDLHKKEPIAKITPALFNQCIVFLISLAIKLKSYPWRILKELGGTLDWDWVIGQNDEPKDKRFISQLKEKYLALKRRESIAFPDSQDNNVLFATDRLEFKNLNTEIKYHRIYLISLVGALGHILQHYLTEKIISEEDSQRINDDLTRCEKLLLHFNENQSLIPGILFSTIEALYLKRSFFINRSPDNEDIHLLHARATQATACSKLYSPSSSPKATKWCLYYDIFMSITFTPALIQCIYGYAKENPALEPLGRTPSFTRVLGDKEIEAIQQNHRQETTLMDDAKVRGEKRMQGARLPTDDPQFIAQIGHLETTPFRTIPIINSALNHPGVVQNRMKLNESVLSNDASGLGIHFVYTGRVVGCSKSPYPEQSVIAENIRSSAVYTSLRPLKQR